MTLLCIVFEGGNQVGYPSLKEVAEQALEWQFIKALPEEAEGFNKIVDIARKGQILYICSYVNAERKARLDIIYSAETFDYIVSRTMGLNEYRDIRFIYKQRDVFANAVVGHIGGMLTEMASKSSHRPLFILKEKGIIDWEYGNKLPEKIGDFELYIKPSETIRHINGSFIFLDYSDFARKNQLTVMYNVLRDEIFAELKVAGIFKTSRSFDCKTLQELERKLKKHLTETLEKIDANAYRE